MKRQAIKLIVSFALLPLLTAPALDLSEPALDTFHRSLTSAQKLAQDRSARTPMDVEHFIERVANASAEVIVLANQLGTNVNKTNIGEAHQLASDLMFNVFGTGRFPVPYQYASAIEAFVRNQLSHTPDDFRLNMVLCRVASSLPATRQEFVYRELTKPTIPQPVQFMAEKALRRLNRLNKPVDLRFIAMDGRTITMDDLKGKVVLLDFWATWCGPCVRELTVLKKLYEANKERGFEIIGISLDSDKEALTRLLQKEEIHWPQYFEPTGRTNLLARTFEIESLPVAWLVDRQGQLRELDARRDLSQKINRLLDEAE